MKRLNPKDKENDQVLMGFFPLIDSYYTDLQNKRFKSFLMSDGTTIEGAEYYQVQDLWKDIAKPDCDFERYLNLLLLAKTKSQVDNLWFSFVEGLHWHAAMITCLLCTTFDCSSNKIRPGSLDYQDFKNCQSSTFQRCWSYSKRTVRAYYQWRVSSKNVKINILCSCIHSKEVEWKY